MYEQAAYVSIGDLHVSASFVNFEPPPFPLGAMGTSDADAFLVDATTALQQRGTTIESIGTPIIQAYQSHRLVTGDLEVSNVTVLTSATSGWIGNTEIIVQPGYGWTFTAKTNGTLVDYYLVGFPLSFAAGGAVTRWAQIPVLANPG
jgi:hypothetical protein